MALAMMAAKRRQRRRAAILPSDSKDPIGADRLIKGAMREFKVRYKRILKHYKSALDGINGFAVNRTYTFDLSAVMLEQLFESLGQHVQNELAGQQYSHWFLNGYIEAAYQAGTSQAFKNLSFQSAVYDTGRSSFIDLIRSDAYQRRVAMIRARQFEDMEGLSAQTKKAMNRVLADGIGRGLNPRDIAEKLEKQTAIELGRAHRIARTEIPMALRRARWDEDQDAEATYQLKGMAMHLSALSPTTRREHARRHGTLSTVEESREWFSEDANAINCKCSTAYVLVDDDGKPLVNSVINKAVAVRKQYFARLKNE